jgi:tetratricopeptide (TPR) repeat protein
LILALGCAARPPAERPVPPRPVAAAARPEAGTVRTLPVTLVTDRTFRELPQWRGLLRSVVRRATEDLDQAAGLRFTYGGEVSWELPLRASTLREILERAAREVTRDGGLVAVFLGEHPPGFEDGEEMGLAFLARPALIVVAPRRRPASAGRLEEHLALFFRHELGHVFGIPHLSGRTVMNPAPESRALDFGDLGLEVLRANRGLDFDAASPFTGADLEALRDVYLLLHQRGDMETALLVDLGTAFRREGRLEEARAILRAARERDRRSVPARLGLAQVTLALGDSVEARTLLEGISRGPDWTPDDSGHLGALWLGLREYDRALSLLTEALEKTPDRFLPWFHRGLAWYHLGHYGRARGDFEEALRREERAEAWFNLGLTLDRLEAHAEATRAFRRYLDLAPEGARSREARDYLQSRGL